MDIDDRCHTATPHELRPPHAYLELALRGQKGQKGINESAQKFHSEAENAFATSNWPPEVANMKRGHKIKTPRPTPPLEVA